MSIISNVHTVVNYDAKKSTAFTGQRLSKVTYKTDRDTGIKKDSKCVSVPPVTGADVQDSLLVLLPAIKDFIQNTQDAIIRARIDAGATEILNSDISMSAVAGFLESESTGGRLTKEFIASWFDTSISDKLSLALAARLGIGDFVTDADQAKIDAAIGMYKDKMSALAGGKTQYPVEIAEKLLKALEFADSDDEIAQKFTLKLTKMKDNVQDIMLSL